MISPIYPTDAQLAVSPYFSQTPIYTPEPSAPVLPAASEPIASPSDAIDISLEARVRSLDSSGLSLSQITELTGVAEGTILFYRGLTPANPLG